MLLENFMSDEWDCLTNTIFKDRAGVFIVPYAAFLWLKSSKWCSFNGVIEHSRWCASTMFSPMLFIHIESAKELNIMG